MDLVLAIGPAVEPVTLQEAKDHLRVTTTDEDTLIQSYIKAAREHVETFTRRALMQQTWDLFLDAFPSSSEIALPMPPLQSVISFTYTDKDGVQTVWDPSNYLVNANKEPGRLVLAYGKSWPAVTLLPTSGIAVRFAAGYKDGASVPEAAKLAIKTLVARAFENREPMPQAAQEIAGTVEAILWPSRVLGW